ETRGSGVMRLTDDGWKIEQYVLSFAVPNDRASAVVDAIRGDAAE
ncbi:MAG: nuclear transport factor 2 family protein, partial [Brevundimonas sp.]